MGYNAGYLSIFELLRQMSHTQSQHPDTASATLELADATDFSDELDDGQTSASQTAAQTIVVGEDWAGLRIDQVAAGLFPDYSRERLKQWINEGQLTVDGQQVKPKFRCNGGEILSLTVTLHVETHTAPEAMDLNIVYEDADILVINKPAGLVVHPGAGNWSGTLVNGLLHYDPSLATLPRAGLVHRIDKDTSGLLVVARNLKAQHELSQQLEDKSVYRVYDALVVGHVIAGGTVNEPIRRHPIDRLKMSVQQGGRPSVTHYRVAERFGTHTWLRVQLETGRTHQIRVHMSHINLPLVGDPVYGGRMRLPRGASPELTQAIQQFKRQALHACELGLIHPRTREHLMFSAPLPDDMQQLLGVLRHEIGRA